MNTFDTANARARAALHSCWAVLIVLLSALMSTAGAAEPSPMLSAGHPVQWWFVFKLNAATFPGCGTNAVRACPFGGEVQNYTSFSQQYVFASDESPQLAQGTGCSGATTTDPVGATFAEIYNGSFHYVLWNDQFYQDPELPNCSGDSCPSPWGHSKGMLVWNDSGDGMVLQVSTPSWPGAGSHTHPRANDDNTLGCVLNNNVKFSQHFFALKLTHADLVDVLQALTNASVVTDPGNSQIVSNGGPADVSALVAGLGKKSASTSATMKKLSSGVTLISKPSGLHVPPWQLVSSLLGSIPLRTATWWTQPEIPTTNASSSVKCWDNGLAAPAAVQIATSGKWQGTSIALKAGPSPNGNHAKIGVSTDSTSDLAIFGDLNQQGAITGNAKACGASQNGRGGLFYVIKDQQLSASVAALIKGQTAPAK
jgi:hypothetical protein